jgi:predicted transcriptional regulator
MTMKNKFVQSMVQSLLDEYLFLEEKKQEADRAARQLKKKVDDLKSKIQDHIGKAESLDTIFLSKIGKYNITQVLRHRDVSAYSYDFIEFVVSKES